MKTIALSAITLMALTGCQSPENNLVRLAAHDSFVIGEELVAQFESETGYEPGTPAPWRYGLVDQPVGFDEECTGC